MTEKKLNELKEKVTDLQEELKELTPEELEQVFSGAGMDYKAKPYGNISWPSSNMTLY